MSAHLAAFVVRGDPAAEARSECDMAQQAWPAYTLAAPASLELDPTSAGVPVRFDAEERSDAARVLGHARVLRTGVRRCQPHASVQTDGNNPQKV